MHRILILFFSLFVFACNKNDRPDVSNIKIDLKVERLEKEMFALEDKNSLKEFLEAHGTLTQGFFEADQYPHDSILINNLFRLINDPHIDTLYQEVESAFGDFSLVKEQFIQAFRHIKYYYPAFEVPKIQTVVTGFGKDLFISDSTIIIGLDYYIGKNATYRPLDIPNYILSRYEKDYIVPSCVLLMSSNYNQVNMEDRTMLADMIFYGKAYYFASKVLPEVQDSILIGYTSTEMEDVKAHQQIVWAHFVQNQLLYETSHFIKKKYVEERPKTLEIGNKAPGRIGVWLGWEIVKQFMKENPEVTLQELMKMEDAQKLFTQSKYKPAPL